MLPLFFIAIFASVYNNWKKVKEEIASRNREM
jgi:cbb3-type cytochrome oxidase subunit 3